MYRIVSDYLAGRIKDQGKKGLQDLDRIQKISNFAADLVLWGSVKCFHDGNRLLEKPV